MNDTTPLDRIPNQHNDGPPLIYLPGLTLLDLTCILTLLPLSFNGCALLRIRCI